MTTHDSDRLTALGTRRLYLRKYFGYSFLLEAVSTPGSQCDRKEFISRKNSIRALGIEPV